MINSLFFLTNSDKYNVRYSRPYITSLDALIELELRDDIIRF